MTLPAAVITCSDSVSAGRHADDSGALAVRELHRIGFDAGQPSAVPDEAQEIAAAVRSALDEGARIVVTNGGTGLGPRDVTIGAVEGLGGVSLPGVGEAIRAQARGRIPSTDLSRSGAFQIGRSLVLCLPGSPGGVEDGLRVAGPLLQHAVAMLDGQGHGHRNEHGSGAKHEHGSEAVRVDGNGHADPSAGPVAAQLTAVVTGEPIDVAALVSAVANEGAGAVITFEGRVRNHDLGRSVERLTYEAHPEATATLAGLVSKAAARPGVAAASAHRTGALAIGDLAFAAVVSAPHRAEAFEVLIRLVDEVKAELPVWKQQRFADGTQEWVNSP